jgi:hypothetical protein
VTSFIGFDRNGCAGGNPARVQLWRRLIFLSFFDAFSAGWGWPDELKEPDFDAIRGRDDFKKLVAEVEAPNKADATKKK